MSSYQERYRLARLRQQQQQVEPANHLPRPACVYCGRKVMFKRRSRTRQGFVCESCVFEQPEEEGGHHD